MCILRMFEDIFLLDVAHLIIITMKPVSLRQVFIFNKTKYIFPYMYFFIPEQLDNDLAYMDFVKRQSAFEHAQSAHIQITLRTRKVSTGTLFRVIHSVVFNHSVC